MIPRVKYAFGNCSAHGLQNVSMQFTWTCDPYCLTLAFVKDTTSCKTLQTTTWTLSRLSAGTLVVNGVPLCAVKKSHTTSMITTSKPGEMQTQREKRVCFGEHSSAMGRIHWDKKGDIWYMRLCFIIGKLHYYEQFSQSKKYFCRRI